MSRVASSQPLAQVPWWLWPTVLCVDAPAVALAWQSLFARQIGARTGAHHAGLLAIAVWLAYAADRWIEGWRLTEQTVRTRRHYFFMRFRWPALVVWGLVLLAGLLLASLTLTAGEWLASLLLLAAVLAYLLSHQLWHRDHPARLPKEFCVAALVAAGAALYPWANQPGHWAELVVPVAWLVALALLNCLLISVWEREVDLSQGQSSLALVPGPWRAWIQFAPAGLAAVACVCAWLDLAGARRASLAAALAAAGLAVLARVQNRIGRERARVLVDVALLSPLLVLIFP